MLNPQEEFARVRLINAVCQGNESEVNRIILRLGERAADVVNNHEIDAAILIEASYYNRINIVRFLLAVPGIDVNPHDRFGYTALMYAAEFGYIDIVRALLAFPGINLEAVNNGDETAATIAQRHGYQQIHDIITSAIHARRAPRVVAPVVAAPSFADRLANIPDFNEETIPKNFIDPISREIMTDPIVCKSGHTYERSSLVSYFKSNGDPVKIDCPVTRINIDIEELENNTCVIIRNLIEEFVFQQEAQYKQRQEQEKKLAAAAAAAASNVNVIDENKPSNEAIPDTEKLHTTRFKMFGNTLSASHSASSLAAQPVEQNNEVEMNCHR